MKIVSIGAAATNFAQLVMAVEAGEEVLVTRDEKPVVRLVTAGQPIFARQFGALAGKVAVTEAFFEALPETEVWDGEQ